MARAGWSELRIKMAMYALAGVFGVLSGLSLIGLTTSADEQAYLDRRLSELETRARVRLGSNAY